MTSPKLDASTRMALDRTRLAHERTMMAWVRTSTSLISFGFTIYKFFEYQTERGVVPPPSRLGPREFAGIMILMGIGAAIIASIEHSRNMKVLRDEYGPVPRSLAGALGAFMGGLGLLALMAVLFRQ